MIRWRSSIWTPAALAYHERMDRRHPPAMAVALQPMLTPRAAGVAYSKHPVTGQMDCVVIDAVPGLAESLVSGQALPDQFIVRTGSSPTIVERLAAEPDRAPALADHDALALAGQVRAVEQALNHPVDVEWVFENETLWLLQARAIPRVATLTEQNCLWSRANFRETLPDVPSPLGISFLQDFMDRAILLGVLVAAAIGGGWLAWEVREHIRGLNHRILALQQTNLAAELDYCTVQFPLNRDGLRADVIYTTQIEYTF